MNQWMRSPFDHFYVLQRKRFDDFSDFMTSVINRGGAENHGINSFSIGFSDIWCCPIFCYSCPFIPKSFICEIQ